MNNKLFSVLLIVLIYAVLLFSGCGANEIVFYFGTSEEPENCTRLELNTSVTIEQNKEKIEESKLVFSKNGDGSFDIMNLCFTGSNIKSVIATSKNKTLQYNHYDTVSRCLEYFNFFYYTGDSKYRNSLDVLELYDAVDPQLDFEARWDKGEFDNIKNVYFNGLSIYEIQRFRRDETKEIGYAEANYYSEDEIRNFNTFWYLDRKETVEEPVIVVDMGVGHDYSKKIPDDNNEFIVQGESVETNPNPTKDSYIFRYEKLFYESQQAALKSKDSFDYSDLIGETLNINVSYNDGSVQVYQIEISFDEKGNIIAALKNTK